MKANTINIHSWYKGHSGNDTGINTLRPRQDGRHFPDDIFKWNFVNENAWIPIKILLKFVPKDPINNIPALVQIMAWCRSGDKPLSDSMMVNLLRHMCVTRPQWVNTPQLPTDSMINVIHVKHQEMKSNEEENYFEVDKITILDCF